jgi:uncharacterized membrane protein YeaQ/YmgE (transglycosylase-associated protein family)
MHIITWIATGLAAGAIVGWAFRGQGYGLLGSLLIGSLGGIVGGWVGRNVLHLTTEGAEGVHFLTALIGGSLIVASVRILDRANRAVRRAPANGD